MSEDFTVSILANDINRDCTGQYHFRNKISKSDQKEKDEADSRLAPKFHPATTRPRLGVVPSLRGETYRTWPIQMTVDRKKVPNAYMCPTYALEIQFLCIERLAALGLCLVEIPLSIRAISAKINY